MANIQIQNLPSASSPLNGSAYVIIKDGLQDKKATVTQMRAIDISAFSAINTPLASDLVMIGRTGIARKTLFQNVGFVEGVMIWFYLSAAPLGWQIVDSLTDCLLAVTGGITYTNPGSGTDGTWQQEGHVLTIAEIPDHVHSLTLGDNSASGQSAIMPRGANNFTIGALTGGVNGSTGGAHNHGDTWRPEAAVGIIARKST